MTAKKRKKSKSKKAAPAKRKSAPRRKKVTTSARSTSQKTRARRHAAPKPACVIIAAKTRAKGVAYFDGAGWDARRGQSAKLLRSVAIKMVPALKRSFGGQLSAIGIFSERDNIETIYQAFDGKKR